MTDQSFVNEFNFPLPREEESKQNVERARNLFRERRQLRDKLQEIQSKINVIDTHLDETCSDIHVFDVRIKFIDEIHPFTSLSVAKCYRKALCDAGIKEEHVTIHLTNAFGDIGFIDGYDPLGSYAHLFDIDIKASVYKSCIKEHEEKKISNDSTWLN